MNLPPDTKILVVDDMRTMRKLVTKYLAELGFTTVLEAGDGGEAWTKIQAALEEKAPFQLIISDWNMPNTKGIHLLRRVRQNTQMKTTPFIMLTAENEQTNVVEAAQLAVTGYIVKPFTKETLEEKLKVIQAPLKAA